MDRRDFLKSSSLLFSSPFFCSSISELITSTKYKTGLQLFSVRDAMENNPIDTLISLKKMGYEDFETYGYDALNKKYYGFSPLDFKSILNDLDVSTYSGHYDVNSLMEVSEDNLKKHVDSCIDGAHALGNKYIVYPMLDSKYHTVQGYKLLINKLNQIGQRITKAGLGFAYHNFDYDFNLYENKLGIDWIINETNPEWVKLQVDFYWVMRSGKLSPKQLIERSKGRFKLWHIKDMDVLTKDYTELGNGSINYKKVLPDASISGLEHYYIEQGGNYKINSMESAQQSISFFMKHIKHLI